MQREAPHLPPHQGHHGPCGGDEGNPRPVAGQHRRGTRGRHDPRQAPDDPRGDPVPVDGGVRRLGRPDPVQPGERPRTEPPRPCGGGVRPHDPGVRYGGTVARRGQHVGGRERRDQLGAAPEGAAVGAEQRGSPVRRMGRPHGSGNRRGVRPRPRGGLTGHDN